MQASAEEWIDSFATVLGVEPPSAAEVQSLLELAGVSAHASERTAAPVSCWLAAKAGVTLDLALSKAADLAASLGGSQPLEAIHDP